MTKSRTYGHRNVSRVWARIRNRFLWRYSYQVFTPSNRMLWSSRKKCFNELTTAFLFSVTTDGFGWLLVLFIGWDQRALSTCVCMYVSDVTFSRQGRKEIRKKRREMKERLKRTRFNSNANGKLINSDLFLLVLVYSRASVASLQALTPSSSLSLLLKILLQCLGVNILISCASNY